MQQVCHSAMKRSGMKNPFYFYTALPRVCTRGYRYVIPAGLKMVPGDRVVLSPQSSALFQYLSRENFSPRYIFRTSGCAAISSGVPCMKMLPSKRR
jgi:hypothetical protein